ncbi:hypothetical protein KM043_003638 [Ampulex compressa]|nr:hypothetical protein KM043_003638 [Ampulex compressa]
MSNYRSNQSGMAELWIFDYRLALPGAERRRLEEHAEAWKSAEGSRVGGESGKQLRNCSNSSELPARESALALLRALSSANSEIKSGQREPRGAAPIRHPIREMTRQLADRKLRTSHYAESARAGPILRLLLHRGFGRAARGALAGATAGGCLESSPFFFDVDRPCVGGARTALWFEGKVGFYDRRSSCSDARKREFSWRPSPTILLALKSRNYVLRGNQKLVKLDKLRDPSRNLGFEVERP